MGSITYNPAPGESQVTEFRGVRLEAGKSVNVKDPRMLAKLEGHPQFDVQISDDERKAAQEGGPNPLAGAVFTSGVPMHRPYYATGGGAAVTDDQEALGGLTAPIRTPTPANAAGGGLNGPTIGDGVSLTRDNLIGHYGAENPLDSQEPSPGRVSEAKPEVVQVQAERAQQAEQAEQAPRPRGRPRREAATEE